MPGTPRVDLTIQQGASFAYNLTWRDGTGAIKALASGWTARLQIRETIDSASTKASLTQAAGITLASTSPNVVIALTATETAALTLANDTAVYDLELVQTSSGTVYRLMGGKVTLSREVTR